jgi:hypothetical protein
MSLFKPFRHKSLGSPEEKSTDLFLDTRAIAA